MRNYKRIPAVILAAAAMMTVAFSCSSKKSSDSESETAASTKAPETSTQAELYSSDDMTINWLSYYDINPEGGAERSVALSLFEDKYNGSVNYIQTTRDRLIPKLEAMINAGEEVDMFPYELRTFPNNVTKGFSAPLDPYYESMGMDIKGLWDDMKDVAEMFAYNGNHYIVPYEATSPMLLTYSRKLFKDEELSDPYELYKEGKWDWDTFTEIIDKFTENAPAGKARYAICGSFRQATRQSAGTATVNYDGSSKKDANAEKAQQLIKDITEKNLYRTYDWQNLLNHCPTDSSTLFYAAEDWTLGDSNAYNEEADLMIVPFPKAPDAQKYTTICDFNANMLAANSAKGRAVATFIMCERYAATDKKFRDAAKQAATAVVKSASGTTLSFVTEEQYDAIQAILSDKNSVLMPDLGYKTEY